MAPIKTSLGITKVQATLPALVRSGETVTILKNGDPVYVLMPMERMEAILETMEIMANPSAMKAIRDYQAGKTKFTTLKKIEKEMKARDARS